jgi:hypothetical protein
MSNDYGDGVSRVLDPTATQYLSLIWQEGAPPCDAEYTLMQDLAAGRLSQSTLAGSPSGWLGNEVNFSKDFVTDPSWSNWFKFGLQAASDHQSVMWANVNGWLIPVTGTRTGLPPGSADNSDTWNKILLDPPPGSAGDARADFVFLEVWKARISPNPSILNKPNAAAIYRYGNVEGGFSYLPDDLIDPEIGEPTTERIQLQYRIRVVKGLVNLSANPDGFDPTVVKAQGSQANPPSVGGYTFTNMKSLLGDPGLWRAGDGTANNLGTVDGYVYAVPICVVFRRNGTDWTGNPSPNLNGSFNRNPTAVDRNGSLTFAPITLNTNMTAGTSYPSISITTTSVMPTTGTIRIGNEILTYNGVSGSTLNTVTRAQFGTINTDSHLIGDTVTLLSGRPDGLFADQVTNTDILDLRHAVNPGGFDYQSLLLSNLDKLFKGQLRSNWKRSGTDPRGSFVFYEDLVSSAPPAISGITALDAPDHFRLAFSDAAVQQPIEVVCRPTTGATYPITTQTPLPSIGWDMEVSSNTLKQAANAIWTSEATDGDGTGDQIQIPITQFQTQTLPGADADQARFLNEVPVASSNGTSFGSTQFVDPTVDFSKLVYPGDIIVVFVGAAKGTYVIATATSSVLIIDPLTSTSPTIPTASPITYIIRRGIGSVHVRLEGSATPLPQHRYEVTPHNPGPTDPLVIRFIGAGAPFPTPSTNTSSSRLFITTNLQYGGGRGLSRRPDSIHNITLVNPTAGVLTKLITYPANSYPLDTAWAVLWSKFRNTPYKGLLPVTAGSYADLGSKTVVLTPFQKISFPDDPYFLTTSNLMPGSEGPSPTHLPSPGTPDPLGLFSHTTYVQLPRHLIPGWGAVYSPIRAIDDADFDQGINFMLASKKGAITDLNQNPTYINYLASTVSCAIFSTHNLSNLSVAIPYNTALSFAGYNYAGTRLFNDDPTAGGALSTARGLSRQGLELPPYYGIARLLGVYEAADYAVRGSAFNVLSHGDRTARTGGADNLLRQDFEGPTFWIELDSTGASTFVLNAETIDIKKSTVNAITSFATGKYVIEANVFGFGQDSFDLTQPFQLALSSAISPTLTVPAPNTIIPAPVRVNDSVLINYSRTPYQGDPWGSQTSFSDMGYLEGPLTSSTAFELVSTDLTRPLSRPNQKPLEVLASVGFITSLGTGRLSGDFVPPNVYEFRNVGYEDPTGPNVYPPPSAVAPRPITKLGAIGSSVIFGDLEANPEYLGCTTRLPLGSLYRDKDFKGGRFSDDFASPLVYTSTTGVGSGVAGLSNSTTLDQTEVLANPASVSSGVPGDVLVHVDGEQVTYTSLTNFRTARGGSVFVGSGDHPGGELFATYERVLGSINGTRALIGRAFLVRNAPTVISGIQVSAGDELMLAVATQVMELGTVPSEAMILLGTNGSGEGYSAADLYRIDGHPLLANHTFYNVDPTTIDLPIGKTISQIVDPPAIEPFPKGAPNTVYASNGTYNFWSNAPTLTSLFLTNDLSVGVSASIAGNVLISSNALTFTNNSRISTPNLSSGTTSNLDIITGDGSGVANTGSITIVPGTSSGTGNGGALILQGGSSTGSSGNGGQAIVAGGTTFNGNGGNVLVRGGTAGVSGNGGSVILASGLGTITNGSVSVRIGALVTVASFTNIDLILGPSSAGNYGIHFTSHTTNTTIDQADAVTGNGSILTIKSQIAAPGNNNGGNINLIAGQGTGSGTTGYVSIANGSRTNLTVNANDTESTFLGHTTIELGDGFYNDVTSLTFSSRVLAPKIGQKPVNGDGETLTIKSADVATAFLGKGGDLEIFAGNATGNISNPHQGGDIYLKAGKGSYTRSGQVIVQVENGATTAPSPVTVTTITSAEFTVNVNDLNFDSPVSAPIIFQKDALASQDGVDLKIQAQKGDQAGGSSHNGGAIILTSGAHGPSGGSNGDIEVRLGTHGYPRAVFDEFGLGINHTELTDTDSGLGLDNCSNDPPTSPAGLSNVLYMGPFGELKVNAAGRGVSTLNGTVLRIVDTSAFTASPVTAAAPTALMASFPTFTGVRDGDIIEGSACFHVVAAASAGNVGTIYLVVKDGSTLDIYQFSFSMNAATDTVVTIPFSYTAGPSTTGIIEIRPEAASSDGVTGIAVSAVSTSGKWIFSKHTRP